MTDKEQNEELFGRDILSYPENGVGAAMEDSTEWNGESPGRDIAIPDGVIRVFSLHVRITNDWRLHFFPLESQKQIIIGYIGEHLPMAKFHM